MHRYAKLGYVALNVSDLERSKTWFEKTLGLRHLFSFGTLAFFDLDGTRLFLSEDPTSDGAESILS